MAIEWFSSETKNGAASFYSSNITLNTIASVPFEKANRIQVGLDDQNNVVIKPVSEEINEKAIYQISIKKTYALDIFFIKLTEEILAYVFLMEI